MTLPSFSFSCQLQAPNPSMLTTYISRPQPTEEPTWHITPFPSVIPPPPTPYPTQNPTPLPTPNPTQYPTNKPTWMPSEKPTWMPSGKPVWSPPVPAWNAWSKPTRRPVNAWNENKWSAWSWGGGWGPKPTKEPTHQPVNAWESSWGGTHGWNGDAWTNDVWTGNSWNW